LRFTGCGVIRIWYCILLGCATVVGCARATPLFGFGLFNLVWLPYLVVLCYGLDYDWSLSYSCLVVVFMVFCLLSRSSFAHSLDHGACFNRVLRVVFIVFSVSSRRQGMTALDGK
ncbi:unnamed protein product, partial [Ectocarpus sp. 12 AP-2014]